MPQSFVSLYVHLVFDTENREPLITEEIRPRLVEYMGGTLRTHDCSLLASGGMPDLVVKRASTGTGPVA